MENSLAVILNCARADEMLLVQKDFHDVASVTDCQHILIYILFHAFVGKNRTMPPPSVMYLRNLVQYCTKSKTIMHRVAHSTKYFVSTY